MHVLAAGPFGLALAERLVVLRPGTSVTDVSRGPARSALWPLADVYVLAAWRPIPRLMAQLDDLVHAWDRVWAPAVLEHPLLRVGPLVRAGAGPCHHCFEDRRAQHTGTAAAEVTRELHRRYDADPTAGPAGFLPGHVSLAAGLTLELLDTGEPGAMRLVDLVGGGVRAGTTVGVHGCPRCGSGNPEAERSTAGLRAYAAAAAARAGASE